MMLAFFRTFFSQRLYVHETSDFWEQVKSPGMTLKASELYLGHFRSVAPELLAAARPGGPTIVGNCHVHPSAKVHASAKLGPNVSVATGARVGPGVRLMNCILLDDVEVRDNAVVQNAIVGWKSAIGAWARVQGSGEYDAKMGICILGEDVKVADEVVVVNCIVLPHKEIKASVKEEVIL
jgi:mannose-1-phosphate guanylyltransferase